MSETMPALRLAAVERRFRTEAGELPVLRGAELSLQAGEIVALVAPSGTGKSTLLHLAGLLEKPDAGEVYVGGRAAGTLSDADRTAIRRTTIGFVYQFHHLLPEFTAEENVVLPQLAAGTPRAAARERARALLAASAWRAASTTGPAASPAASSSAWRSPALWPMRRASCWPTSRPGTSMSAPPGWSSRNCWRRCAARAWPR